MTTEDEPELEATGSISVSLPVDGLARRRDRDRRGLADLEARQVGLGEARRVTCIWVRLHLDRVARRGIERRARSRPR